MPSTVLISELAIVERTDPDEPNRRELMFGFVVSGRYLNDSSDGLESSTPSYDRRRTRHRNLSRRRVQRHANVLRCVRSTRRRSK